MIEADRLVAFAGMTAVLVAAPGPGILVVVSRALVSGGRLAVLTALGGGVGLAGQSLVVAFGLGAVIADRPGVLTSITLLGALYLGYLGVQGVRRRRVLVAEAMAGTAPARQRTARAFRDGAVVGVTNPKRLLIPAVVAPQFAVPAGGGATGQLLALGGISVLIALAIDVAAGVLAGTARVRLGRSVRRLERAGGLAGAVMVALGAYLAVTSQLG